MSNTNKPAVNAGTAIAHYTAALKGWQRYMGEKPSEAHFTQAHAWGVRPGSNVALALAMYCRPEGATQAQVSGPCNGPQLNKARMLVATGKAVWAANERDCNGHTIYRLRLPEPVKPVAKGKAGKVAKAAAKVAKVTPPPVETQPVEGNAAATESGNA
jgi:hypothetical protein